MLDLTPHLNSSNVESLYTEDLYGVHLSEQCNQLVASKLSDDLKKTSIS